MSPNTTRAPSLTNVSASAAPCPRAPPLMSATLPSSFPMTISPSARGRWMIGDPVTSDVDAPGEPDALVAGDVVERALEAGGARRMPDQPQVQAERHHLGLRAALTVEDIEAVLDERVVVVRGEEAAAAELGVVGREAIRHDQVRAIVHAHPVGELVVVRVGVVEEAAFLDQQPTRVDAGAVAAVPAERPFAYRLLHG